MRDGFFFSVFLHLRCRLLLIIPSPGFAAQPSIADAVFELAPLRAVFAAFISSASFFDAISLRSDNAQIEMI